MLRTLLKFSGLIASSWALSWCLYRLQGIRLIGRPHEEIWYFAYGANMHDSAFREWRSLRPTEWAISGASVDYRLERDGVICRIKFPLGSTPPSQAEHSSAGQYKRGDSLASKFQAVLRIAKRALGLPKTLL